MPWKIAQFDFHAVELFAPQEETTTPVREGRLRPRRREGRREDDWTCSRAGMREYREQAFSCFGEAVGFSLEKGGGGW